MEPSANANPQAPEKGHELILTAAIDLGAKTTGVWSTLHRCGEDPAATPEAVALIANSEWLTLSQSHRTQMRHMRRGVQRRKLAKRLVRLWLQTMRADEFRTLGRDALELLHGLMNRRGFTYFSLDESIEPGELDPYTSAMAPLLRDIEDAATLTDWIRQTIADPSGLEEVLARPVFAAKGAALTALVQTALHEQGLDEDFKPQDVVRRIRAVRSLLDRAAKTATAGHRHRTEYLQDIHRDLTEHESGQRLCTELRISADELAGLIGHIGNWPLKALRGYFHDPTKAVNHRLDPRRFHSAWTRWIGSWTLAGESGERRQQRAAARRRWRQLLLQTSPTDRDALWRLLTREPAEETIPPYESQGNRRPPVCQSLVLDPDALDDIAPAWQTWAARLYRPDGPDDRLTRIATHDAMALQRRPSESRGMTAQEADVLRWKLARALHRILDRSTAADPYSLRALCRHRQSGHQQSQRLAAACAELEHAVGEQNLDAFLELAQSYYQAAERARVGVAFPSEFGRVSILRACGVHPPHKDKVLGDLLAAVLTTEATEEQVRRAIAQIGRIDFPPDTSLGERFRRPRPRKFERILEELADQQKQLGGRLRQYADLARRFEGSVPNAPSRGDSLFDAWVWWKWGEAAAAALARELGHRDQVCDRYRNPYSMAQLHQILYVDRHGFSSTCRACTLENSWRATLDGAGIANAARLPSDSIRPFDGMLARLLGAKATRVASHLEGRVIKHLRENPGLASLRVNVLIEENRFEFNEQLASVKKLPAQKVKLRHASAEQDRQAIEKDWRDKRTRIRDAAHEICAYTGTYLGNDGEFDHIVSRAETTDLAGYAFDSEANLIYVSRPGNRAKGRSTITFDQLHDEYLSRVFDGKGRAAAETDVRDLSLRWLDDRALDVKAFHQLDEPLQRAVRHALFIPDLRRRVLWRLDQQNRTRVNGTQRWFARQLLHRLAGRISRTVPITSVAVHRVPSESVSALRRELDIRKPDEQPPYSHAVDAALVYAVASTVPAVRDDLGLATNADTSVLEFTEADRARALLPGSLSLVRIERVPIYAKPDPEHRPLLKAGLYGEHFLSVAIDSEGKAYIGFDRDNWVEVQSGGRRKPSDLEPRPGQQLLETLWPVLRRPANMSDPDLDALARLAGNRNTGLYWLSLDRRKAFEYWARAMRGPDPLFETLKALRYCTKKVDIVGKLENGGKVAPDASSILGKNKKTEKLFSIKVDLSIQGNSSNLRGIRCHGLLEYPAIRHWQRLVADPELAPILGRQKVRFVVGPRSPDMAEADEKASKAVKIDLRALAARHFASPATSRSHVRTRQTWSLPIVEAPSGAMRLQRRAWDGSPVYQLVASDEGLYRAFLANVKATLGFEKHAIVLEPFSHLALQEPPKTAPVSGQVRFDRFIPLPESVVRASPFVKIEIAPGSVERRQVRLTIAWHELDSLLGGSFAAPIEEVPAELTLDDRQARRLTDTLRKVTGEGQLGPRVSSDRGTAKVVWMDRQQVCLQYGAGSPGNGATGDENAAGAGSDRGI